jgi:hypothetical protein
MIENCELDADRLAIISECTETYGMEERAPENEWVWNIISRKVVVYSCGAIGRVGEDLAHHHDPVELELCQQLAKSAADLTVGEFIEMGDESSHEFLPFYVVANIGQKAPVQITEDFVRQAFGGTIYPDADVLVEPIEGGKNWWLLVEKDSPDEDRDYLDRQIAMWSRLEDWFHSEARLRSPVFVSIDPNDDKERAKGNAYNGGCVLPRMVVGITAAGSLVGLFSCVVHT